VGATFRRGRISVVGDPQGAVVSMTKLAQPPA
jgi:hypothetical protein